MCASTCLSSFLHPYTPLYLAMPPSLSFSAIILIHRQKLEVILDCRQCIAPNANTDSVGEMPVFILLSVVCHHILILLGIIFVLAGNSHSDSAPQGMSVSVSPSACTYNTITEDNETQRETNHDRTWPPVTCVHELSQEADTHMERKLSYTSHNEYHTHTQGEEDKIHVTQWITHTHIYEEKDKINVIYEKTQVTQRVSHTHTWVTGHTYMSRHKSYTGGEASHK